MKVIACCAICMKNASEKFISNGGPSSVKFYSAEMDDNGLVYIECDKGHKSANILTGSKHQFLFESGCKALIDGYTNEAVSSFTAALERTYEFFIRVAYRKLRISSEILESTWKNVHAQSERQLGAFLFLYPIIADESFEILNKIQEFRNRVLHKGYISQTEEVFKYASNIFTLIRQIISFLNNKCSTEMWAEINEAVQKQKELVSNKMEWTYLGVTPFDSRKDLTFEAWIEELKTQKHKEVHIY